MAYNYDVCVSEKHREQGRKEKVSHKKTLIVFFSVPQGAWWRTDNATAGDTSSVDSVRRCSPAISALRSTTTNTKQKIPRGTHPATLRCRWEHSYDSAQLNNPHLSSLDLQQQKMSCCVGVELLGGQVRRLNRIRYKKTQHTYIFINTIEQPYLSFSFRNRVW